jgi:hypothetical protein
VLAFDLPKLKEENLRPPPLAARKAALGCCATQPPACSCGSFDGFLDSAHVPAKWTPVRR